MDNYLYCHSVSVPKFHLYSYWYIVVMLQMNGGNRTDLICKWCIYVKSWWKYVIACSVMLVLRYFRCGKGGQWNHNLVCGEVVMRARCKTAPLEWVPQSCVEHWFSFSTIATKLMSNWVLLVLFCFHFKFGLHLHLLGVTILKTLKQLLLFLPLSSLPLCFCV